MQAEAPKRFIYLPTLHRNLAEPSIPSGVEFLCPGLASRNFANLESAWVPSSLPFTGREAEAVLRETTELGITFSKGGDLKLMAGQGWLEKEEQRKQKLADEKNAISEFARTGEIIQGADSNKWARELNQERTTSLQDQFKNAQKALMLAWDLEENLIDIARVDAKAALAEQKLALALGEDASDLGHEANPEDAADFVRSFAAGAGDVGIPLPSWRVIFDAASAFLPDDCLLLACNKNIYEDLRSSGLLQPLPGDVAALCTGWEESFVASCLWVNQPLWRILGYATLPEDRPWLGATHDLLVKARFDF